MKKNNKIQHISYYGLLKEFRVDKKKIVKRYWQTGLFFLLFTWIVLPFIYAALFSAVIIIIMGLISEYDNLYNGYKLDKNLLYIYNDAYFKQEQTIIKIEDILSVNYYCASGSKNTDTITYKTKKGIYISYIPNGIFSFAPVLKYLKYEKGIKITTSGYADYEINIYLENKIDKIPMENKY